MLLFNRNPPSEFFLRVSRKRRTRDHVSREFNVISSAGTGKACDFRAFWYLPDGVAGRELQPLLASQADRGRREMEGCNFGETAESLRMWEGGNGISQMLPVDFRKFCHIMLCRVLHCPFRKKCTENVVDINVFIWEETKMLKNILRVFLISCEFPWEFP